MRNKGTVGTVFLVLFGIVPLVAAFTAKDWRFKKAVQVCTDTKGMDFEECKAIVSAMTDSQLLDSIRDK